MAATRCLPQGAFLRSPWYSIIHMNNLFVSDSYALYDSLSRGLRSYLETLNAVHVQSGATKSDKAQHRHQRRPPVSPYFKPWCIFFLCTLSHRSRVFIRLCTYTLQPAGNQFILTLHQQEILWESPKVKAKCYWNISSTSLGERLRCLIMSYIQ